MELIAKIVMLASCAVCVLVQTVYFTHMMQLNSYRNERYRKWCKDHEEKVVNLRRLLPALRTPGYVFQSGRDELVSPRSCQLLKAHPALELSELPASSHFYYAPQDRERMLACFSGACSRLLR